MFFEFEVTELRAVPCYYIVEADDSKTALEKATNGETIYGGELVAEGYPSEVMSRENAALLACRDNLVPPEFISFDEPMRGSTTLRMNTRLYRGWEYGFRSSTRNSDQPPGWIRTKRVARE